MPKGMKEARRAFYLGVLRAFLWAYAMIYITPPDVLRKPSEWAKKRRSPAGNNRGEIELKSCENDLGDALGDAVFGLRGCIKKLNRKRNVHLGDAKMHLGDA